MASIIAAVTAAFPTLNAYAVKDGFDTDATDDEINAAINIAYYRTRSLSGKLGDCGGASMEEQIIILVARHLVAVNEGDVAEQWVGREWRVKYRGADKGEGLRATLWGQQAIAMDCSGTLAKAGKKKAGVYVVDHDRAEEHDIVVDS